MVNTKVRVPIRADAKDYFMYAYNLKYRNVYSRDIGNYLNNGETVRPDAVRSPGYPIILTLFMKNDGLKLSITNIQFFQMIISTFTILLSYFMLKGFLSSVSALIVSCLIAISPHLITANCYVLSETLFCFFLVLAGTILRTLASRPFAWVGFLFGIVLGLTTLVRPSLQFFPLVMGVLLPAQFGRRKGLRLFVCVALGFALILGPWYIRNLATLSKISDDTIMINFLHHGMYPNFKYKDQAESYGYPYKFDARSKNISRNTESVLTEIVKNFMQEPWLYTKWYLFNKPVKLWSWKLIQGHKEIFVYEVAKSPYFYQNEFIWSYRFMRGIHRLLVLLALCGCMFAWTPNYSGMTEKSVFTVRFASVLLIYFTIIHMIGAPFPRYAVPLRPYTYGMALFGVGYLLKYFVKYSNSMISKVSTNR
jgi:4-amino-4-deoxy-L-arabinose transferase-like glycosyltransferase